MQLHLVRHLPVQVAAGTCYGRSDLPAAAPDDDAVQTLRAQLGEPRHCRVFSSPSSRCAQLARRIAPHADALQLDPRLQEIDFGAWELRAFDDIGREAIEAWAAAPWDFVPPGGESAQAMSARVLAALRDIRVQPAAVTVIVAHGGPLRVILGQLLRLPRRDWLALAFEPGAVVSLQLGDAADLQAAQTLARRSLVAARA